MLTNLHLLFIARQGYWKEEKEISPKYLWLYLLPYLAWSVLLLLLSLFFKSEVLSFLATYPFLATISYRQLTEVLLYLIVVVGIVYENSYLIKTKTLETMRLFFAMPTGQLAFLLWLRNGVIILPALVAGFFFKPWLPLFLFILTHLLSLPLIKSYYQLTNRQLMKAWHWGSDWSYIRTVVDDLSLLKAFFLPLASLLLFFLWAKTGSSLELFNPSKTAPVFTALFVGSLVFYSKSPSYLFLSLWQDFPYLQVLGLNLMTFLVSKLLLMSVLSYGLVALPLLFFYAYQGASFGQMTCLALALFLVYGLLQSFQWRESLFFKDKRFVHAKEIETYRLPLIYYLRRLGLSLALTAFAFLFARHLSVSLLAGFVSFSLVIQVINYGLFFKHYQY